jgi:2,5-diamino-6-(ribosylamino)-4(3H)-pyrimidinone 5'-phosphate reductase
MNRPEVITLQEASLDGKLAVSSDQPLLFGDERWESMRGFKSFNLFKWLMTNRGIQATLEGSNSFLRACDTPEALPSFEGDPTSLYQDYLPKEIVHREGHRGWFIAVDSRGRIRWRYKDGYPGDETWIGWHAMVLVSKNTPPAYLYYLRKETIPYLICGEKQVDLKNALAKMKNVLHINTLLATAGGVINGLLLKEELVDEINIEFLPGIVGGGDAPSLFKGFVLCNGESPVLLKLLSCTVQSGGQVWVRYEVLYNVENVHDGTHQDECL